MNNPLLTPAPNSRPLKKIGIEMGGAYLILTADEAAPLIAALTHCRLYEKDGYGKDAMFKPTDKAPDIILIPDRLIERDLAGMVAAVTDTTAT